MDLVVKRRRLFHWRIKNLFFHLIELKLPRYFSVHAVELIHKKINLTAQPVSELSLILPYWSPRFILECRSVKWPIAKRS